MTKTDQGGNPRKPSRFWMLLNDEYSLKAQMLCFFISAVFAAASLTLGLCIGMIYATGANSYESADSIIVSSTRANAANIANEIANSIEQQLMAVANTVVYSGALFANNLVNEPIWQVEPSYREYHFEGQCNYPNCPKDYGTIATRSRIPHLEGFKNGSLLHSSVYLYSKAESRSLRNDSSWSIAFRDNPMLPTVLNAMTYLDYDFANAYTKGLNATVMYYLSTKVAQTDSTGANNYYVLHRTYPGILKNNTDYDPSLRSWFKNAPQDSALNLYGPYQESFTKQFTVTLSTKKVAWKTSSSNGRTYALTTVAAAVILIKDLSSIINEMTFANDGFAVLLRSMTNEVLVWGNETNTYNDQLRAFKTVSYYDANLGQRSFQNDYKFTHTDSDGIKWMVVCNAFFPTTVSNTDSLSILVFSKYSELEFPLLALKDNIDSTTSTVTIYTIITVCGTMLITLLLVACVIHIITKPLETMRGISEDVVKMTTEDEDSKDYTELVQRSYHNILRNDEIGILSSDYYHLVLLLQEKLEEKRSLKKHIENPFHISIEILQELSNGSYGNNGSFSFSFKKFANWYEHRMQNHREQQQNEPQQQHDSQFSQHQISPNDGLDLDILGSLSKQVQSNKQKSHGPINPNFNNQNAADGGKYSVIPSCAVPEEGIELAQPVFSPNQAVHSNGYHQVSIRGASSTSSFQKVEMKKINICNSLGTQLYLLSILTLIGMVLAMIITIVLLDRDGQLWMSGSSDDLVNTAIVNLQGITITKASFVKAYFLQMSLEISAGAALFTKLMDGHIYTGNYVPSYSIDFYSPYSNFDTSTYYSTSGYYISTDAQCQETYSCGTTNSADETQKTSVFDLKLEAYNYNGNILSFAQLAVDKDSFTRYYPYSVSKTNSYPTTCLVVPYISTAPSGSVCYDKYYQSKCGAPDVYSSYPAYDVRCRYWYQLSTQVSDPSIVSFLYPRVSSSGKYVITGLTPIRSNSTADGTFLGAFSMAFSVQSLSNAINELTILHSGYVYLVDSKNVSQIILHPHATASSTSGCGSVRCVETQFSISEYETFYRDVLLSLPEHESVTTTYMKSGERWRLVSSRVIVDSMDYILIATVPDSEVLEASNDVENKINSAIVAMIVVFVIVMAIFSFVFLYCTKKLVHSVIEPVTDLGKVLQQASQGESATSSSVASFSTAPFPTTASSLDMKVLLQACSNLLVALKFGNDSYARGNVQRAQEIFQEAFNLFTATGNLRGKGASLNNLGSVALSKRQYQQAQDYFEQAIACGEELLQKLSKKSTESRQGDGAVSTTDKDKSSTDKQKKLKREIKNLQRIISDRKGNLVAAHLERKDFQIAFALLESLLDDDKKTLYIKGCIVKQGNLGQFYLQQGELKSAEKVFKSALEFIRNKQVLYGLLEQANNQQHIDEMEIMEAEQRALFNIAMLEEEKWIQETKNNSPNTTVLDTQGRERLDHIQSCYLEPLVLLPYMHIGTTNSILSRLKKLYTKYALTDGADLIMKMAKDHDFHLDGAGGGGGGGDGVASTKRVVFCIDYSGSMSGMKIRSAVSNLENIVQQYIFGQDSVMFLTFNNILTTVLPMTTKELNEQKITDQIKTMTSPNNGTALYDAIKFAIQTLTQNPSGSTHVTSDWVVALTDGEDNQSSCKLPVLVDYIRQHSSIGVIIVGIGEDVQESILSQIAQAAKKGKYIFAKADQNSIKEAFGEVATMIQSQVVMEDY